MLVHNVNNDGLNDIIYGAAHDYRLFCFEHGENESRTIHPIDTSWSQIYCLVLYDINVDGKLDLITGKRLRGHGVKDPGAAEPLGIYWYDIDREQATFTKNVITYNERIGTGMQIDIRDINEDDDADNIVSGKSGLYLLENKTYFNNSHHVN